MWESWDPDMRVLFPEIFCVPYDFSIISDGDLNVIYPNASFCSVDIGESLVPLDLKNMISDVLAGASEIIEPNG